MSKNSFTLFLTSINSCSFNVVHIADAGHCIFEKCSNTYGIFSTLCSIHFMFQRIRGDCWHQRFDLEQNAKLDQYQHAQITTLFENDKQKTISIINWYKNVMLLIKLPFFRRLLLRQMPLQFDNWILKFLPMTPA